MKKFVLAAAMFLWLLPTVFGQSDFNDFYDKSAAINKTGMYVLGGWAIANIATGAIGWSNTGGSTMRFHQMNLFWNTVNLSIAGFALYNYLQTNAAGLNPDEILQTHRKTENLYLINAGLDVLYVGTGFYLKHLSAKKTKKEDLLLGYGNSIMLQGAFLFVFDAVMWGIQRNNRLGFTENLQLSVAGDLGILQFGIVLPF
jgi:hypothetical protein